jgi:hypothetical protein
MIEILDDKIVSGAINIKDFPFFIEANRIHYFINHDHHTLHP